MPYANNSAGDTGALLELISSKAPINHAIAGNTYGLSSESNYGHMLFTRQGSSSTHLPVINGTANTGLGLRAARHDHVHPVDTGRAPANHASTQPVHGTASETEYGHVQLATSLPAGNGVAAIGVSQRAAREDHVHPGGESSGIAAVVLTSLTDAVLSFENGGWRTVPVGVIGGTSRQSILTGHADLVEIAENSSIRFLQDGTYLINAVLSTYDGQQRQLRLSLNDVPFLVGPPAGEGEYQLHLTAMGLINAFSGQELTVEVYNRGGTMYVPSSNATAFTATQEGVGADAGFKPYLQMSILRLG